MLGMVQRHRIPDSPLFRLFGPRATLLYGDDATRNRLASTAQQHSSSVGKMLSAQVANALFETQWRSRSCVPLHGSRYTVQNWYSYSSELQVQYHCMYSTTACTVPLHVQYHCMYSTTA